MQRDNVRKVVGGRGGGWTDPSGMEYQGLKFSSVRWLPEAVDAIRRHTQSGATKEGLKRPSKSNSDLRTKDSADDQEPGKYRYGVEPGKYRCAVQLTQLEGWQGRIVVTNIQTSQDSKAP